MQPVAHARGGLDQRSGTVIEFLPQLVHIGVKVLRLAAVAGTPYGSKDHLVAAGQIGVAGQVGQHFELFGGEVDGGAVQAGVVVHEVELERAEGERGRQRLVGFDGAMADGGSYPGLQFAMPNGLVM